MTPKHIGILCIAAIFVLLGCQAEPEHYSVRGRVVGTGQGGRTLAIDHEEIPGYMDAMQMTLPVRDPSAAEGLEEGDKIRFELVISNDRGSVGEIEVLSQDTELTLADPGAAGHP